MENIGEKRMDVISKWEEKSRDFIDAFLLLFGREGRLVGIRGCGFFIIFALYTIILIIGVITAVGFTAKKSASKIGYLLR